MAAYKQVLRKIMVFPIRVYQYLISPLLGPRCRFYPSCSDYAISAIKQHGIKGFWYGFLRLLRCHPWSKGGHDPVPNKRDY